MNIRRLERIWKLLDSLPPFRALNVFDAVAQRSNITRAADDLGVTPAAVSQQIKSLEDHLGIDLFVRHKNGVTLTELGRDYLPFVRDAFARLRLGGRHLNRAKEANVLTISATPSIATKCLSPMLLSWMEEYPDVSVRLDARQDDVDFSHSSADFRICFGPQPVEGLVCHELLTDYVTPVCSPSLIPGPHPIENPSAICEHGLIHIEWAAEGANLPSWDSWLEAAGVSDERQRPGAHFNIAAMGIEAAIQGAGVALGQGLFIQTELRSGLLVRLSELSLPLGKPYYLVYPEKLRDTPKAQMFIDWLRHKFEEQFGENRRI